MCRVRFGVDGIYFAELQPSRFREEFYRPLISKTPGVVRGNIVGNNHPSAIVGKRRRWREARVLPESLVEWRPGKDFNRRKNITHIIPSSSSSSSGDDGRRQLLKKADIKKRSRHSSSSSSSSSSDGHHHSSTKDKETNGTRKKKSSQAETPIQQESQQTQSGPASVSATSKKSKGPPNKRVRFSRASSPAKKVRFADMVEEKTIVNDAANDDDSQSKSSSSSHSTYDSYIDPPPPVEPYDVFSGYYRSPGVSEAYHTALRRNWRSRLGMTERHDDTHGYLDASDGSGIDADSAVVAGPTRRSRQVPNFHAIRNSGSGSPASQSWASGSELESNIDDDGGDSAQSRLRRQRSLSPLVASKRLRYPKLRSTKPFPEPVFVVRSKVRANRKSTRNRPNDLRRMANAGEETHLREEYEARKAARPSPAPDKGAEKEKDKARNYKPPSISDGVENEP